MSALLAGCLIGSALLALGGPVLSGLSAYIGMLVAAAVHTAMTVVTRGRYYTSKDPAPTGPRTLFPETTDTQIQ